MTQKEQQNNFKHHADSCWSWVVCAVSFISLTIVIGYSISWGVLLPAVIDHFNETRAKTALVGSLANGLGYGISPLCSILCSRFGFRIIAIIGTVMIATGLVLSSLVSNLSLMLITYSATVGAGYAFVYFANIMAVTKYFVRRRAIAVGIVTSGACSGILVISQSNTALLERFGLKKTLRAMAVTMVVPFLCSFTFNPSVSSGETKHQLGFPDKEPKKSSCFGISVLRNKLFTLYTASFMIVFMTYYVLPYHIVKYGDELGIPRHDMANLYIYLAICQFFSRLLFSYLASFKAVNIFYLYQTAASACGIIYVVIPFAITVNHLLLIIIAFGLMDGGLYGICILIVAHCVDADELPQAIGIFTTVTTMFSAMGPLFAGLIADESGSYAAAFYTSGVVILLGASLMFFKNCVQPVNKEQDCFTVTTVLVVERETVL